MVKAPHPLFCRGRIRLRLTVPVPVLAPAGRSLRAVSRDDTGVIDPAVIDTPSPP
jgi:hypothetical protein